MKIAIIHPWLPQYRLEFFELLVRQGALEGLDFRIFYGEPSPEWRARNDDTESDIAQKLATVFFHITGRSVNYKQLDRFTSLGPYDLVILEQAVRNLETYQLVFQNAPVAFWGHGRTYTKKSGRLQESVKMWLTRKGVWFFAYTPGGADAVAAAGFPRERASVVQNAIDTAALSNSLALVQDEERRRFKAAHDLHGKTALFIGGLDQSKRLKFLFDAAALVHKKDPDFRLIIAGNGADQDFVQREVGHASYISYVGALFGRDKAIALDASQVMAMPGRVGLVAVDSFASGTPIVTTDWEWHAPEFEYLEDGHSAVITANDLVAYAAGLSEALGDPVNLERLSLNCRELSRRYTVENMVQNFIEGVKKALGLRL